MNTSSLRIAIIVCLLTATNLLYAQSNPRKPKGLNHYKGVHQGILAKIVEGKPAAAIIDLEAIIEEFPEDAESYYMLAVAQANSGDKQVAIKAAKQAVANGLPAGRFFAGSKTGLESIQNEPEFLEFRKEFEDVLPHGPMLGCISGSGVKVWVRTTGPGTVRTSVAVVGDTNTVISSNLVAATENTDYTAVMEIKGLKPNTEYSYRINVIDGDRSESKRQKGGRFKTLVERKAPVKFRIAFGGGAGFVPQHEYMWKTIGAENPDVLMLLGDNVYSDAPKIPEIQHYCYYRRQSRPEYQKLVSTTPVYSIWDDHDFGTNDCSGGPAIDKPFWKLSVYRVFRNNWVNPYYGGGETQPGCYYDYYIGDVHFIMLDGRYYRNLTPTDGTIPTMLGPVQRQWLLDKIKSSDGNLLVLCSPVPWVYKAKGDSKDTWNGFQEERSQIFDFLTKNKVEGVVLMSADRHRSDLWKIDRSNDYPLYEFNSSRLTNQHVHTEMKEAVFSYNKKQSFGTVDIDTTADDPTITYRVVSIDGEEIHKYTLKRSELVHQ